MNFSPDPPPPSPDPAPAMPTRPVRPDRPDGPDGPDGLAGAADLAADAQFMAEALRLAARALAADEVPVGAVIARHGRLIARAHNQTEMLKDPTAHAEMIAITQAAAAVGDWRLADCTLYVTKEPCPMCAGAMVLARLDRVVFGCPDPKAGAAGGSLNLLQHPALNHRCTVTGGVAAEACRQLLVAFFREKRG